MDKKELAIDCVRVVCLSVMAIRQAERIKPDMIYVNLALDAMMAAWNFIQAAGLREFLPDSTYESTRERVTRYLHVDETGYAVDYGYRYPYI